MNKTHTFPLEHYADQMVKEWREQRGCDRLEESEREDFVLCFQMAQEQSREESGSYDDDWPMATEAETHQLFDLLRHRLAH